MRCPDCNKFVSYDEPQVEQQSLDLEEDGTIRASYRVVLNCADCGNELKDTTLEMESSVDLSDHQGDTHEVEIEEDSVEGVCEPGSDRWSKTYYGASVTVVVTCSCGNLNASIEMSDKVSASEMDELV